MFDPNHKKLNQQTQDLNEDSDDPFRRSDLSDDSTDPLTRHIHKPQVKVGAMNLRRWCTDTRTRIIIRRAWPRAAVAGQKPWLPMVFDLRGAMGGRAGVFVPSGAVKCGASRSLIFGENRPARL